MENNYPLCNLGSYGRAIVAAKKAGDMDAYIKSFSKSAAIKTSLIAGGIGLAAVAITAIVTAAIVKHSYEKKAKSQMANQSIN